jgi:streptogramin lyase
VPNPTEEIQRTTPGNEFGRVRALRLLAFDTPKIAALQHRLNYTIWWQLCQYIFVLCAQQHRSGQNEAGSRPHQEIWESQGVRFLQQPIRESHNTPFFCEFGTNKLARIDPSTMRVREYSLPPADARPRRIALAPEGTIYYSDFARGYLGRFDPSGGKLPKEWLSPGGSESEPYGIAITNDGYTPGKDSRQNVTLADRDLLETSRCEAHRLSNAWGIVIANVIRTKQIYLY